MKKVLFFLLILIIAKITYPQTPAGNCLHIDYDIWNSGSNPTVYFDCGNNSILNTGYELTIESWINIYDNGWNQKIVGKIDGDGSVFDNGYVQAIQGGQIYSQVWNPAATGLSFGALPQDSIWAHFATTFMAGDSMKVYINGILMGAASVPANPIESGNSSLIIGVCPWQTYSSFQTFGNIDEIRIWNYAKSIEQIRADMHRQLKGDEQSLIAYYDFNETSGDSLHDRTINHNDGKCNTPTTAPYWWWENSFAPVGNERMFNQQDINAVWYGKDLTVNPFVATQTGLNLVSDIQALSYDFIVYGNNTDTGVTTSDLATGAPVNFVRANRIWYANKGGNVNTDMIFNLTNVAGGGTSLSSTAPTINYTLLVRDDSTGNFSPVAQADYKAGVGVKFSGFNIQNKYYTIGVGSTPWAGISENSGPAEEIKIYPNPVKDKLNISKTTNNEVQITVCDLTGKILKEIDSEGKLISMDVCGLSNGIYFLRIKNGNEILNKKIIINK